MKNSLSKNRISSLFTSPNNLTPTVDFYKQELATEMSKVENDLAREFLLTTRNKSTDSIQQKSEQQSLKSTLNNLISLNKQKSSHLQALKSLSNLKSQSNHLPTPSNQQESFHNKLSTLQNELKKMENQIKLNTSEQETLQEMKNQEIYNIMSFKEKLEHLTKVYKAKTSELEQKMIKKIQSGFLNTEAQEKLKFGKGVIQKSQIKRETAMDLLKKNKKHQEKMIKLSIYNISEANMKEKEIYARRFETQELIESTILESSQNIETRESSQKVLFEIRQSLSTIRNNIKDSPDFTEPLSANNILFIVDAYAKLKFQEQSLSLKFQNLTEEQMEKQVKCDKIHEELGILKANEVNSQTSNSKKMTFNQLKLALDNQELREKNFFFLETQNVMIQLHLKILNFTEKIKKNIENVCGQCRGIGKDEELQKCLDNINCLNMGRLTQPSRDVFQRRKSVTLVEKRRGKPFVVADKVYKQTISEGKIKELLMKNYEFLMRYKGSERINIDEIAKMVAEDAIACFFIEISGIDSKMIGFLSSPKLMIIELNKIACENFKNQVKDTFSSISDTLTLLNSKTSQGKDKILAFYSENSPESLPEIKKFMEIGQFLPVPEIYERILMKKDVKEREDLGVKAFTEGNLAEKSTKSSSQISHFGKTPKTSKNTEKIPGFDFKVHSASHKKLRLAENDRLSVRYSPAFVLTTMSSSSNFHKHSDRLIYK